MLQAPNKIKQSDKNIIDENGKRGPYRKYTTEVRDRAIKLSQKLGSPGKASQVLKIPIKNLRRWIIKGPHRKAGGGRRSHDPGMEREMVAWAKKNFEKTGQLPSHPEARAQAMSLAGNDTNFKASKGWFEKFLRRHFKEQRTTSKIRSKTSNSVSPVILPIVYSPGSKDTNSPINDILQKEWERAYKWNGNKL